MQVLTFDINIGTVLVDLVPSSQSDSVNTLMLLVRGPHGDRRLVVGGLHVHGGREMQLDAWGRQTFVQSATRLVHVSHL